MGVGGQLHAPATLPPPPGKTQYPMEGGWAPGPVWMGAENLTPTRIPPDCPAHSKSLYWLNYPGPLIAIVLCFCLLRCCSLLMQFITLPYDCSCWASLWRFFLTW